MLSLNSIRYLIKLGKIKSIPFEDTKGNPCIVNVEQKVLAISNLEISNLFNFYQDSDGKRIRLIGVLTLPLGLSDNDMKLTQFSPRGMQQIPEDNKESLPPSHLTQALLSLEYNLPREEITKEFIKLFTDIFQQIRQLNVYDYGNFQNKHQEFLNSPIKLIFDEVNRIERLQGINRGFAALPSLCSTMPLEELIHFHQLMSENILPDLQNKSKQSQPEPVQQTNQQIIDELKGLLHETFRKGLSLEDQDLMDFLKLLKEKNLIPPLINLGSYSSDTVRVHVSQYRDYIISALIQNKNQDELNALHQLLKKEIIPQLDNKLASYAPQQPLPQHQSQPIQSAQQPQQTPEQTHTDLKRLLEKVFIKAAKLDNRDLEDLLSREKNLFPYQLGLSQFDIATVKHYMAEQTNSLISFLIDADINKQIELHARFTEILSSIEATLASYQQKRSFSSPTQPQQSQPVAPAKQPKEDQNEKQRLINRIKEKAKLFYEISEKLGFKDVQTWHDEQSDDFQNFQIDEFKVNHVGKYKVFWSESDFNLAQKLEGLHCYPITDHHTLNDKKLEELSTLEKKLDTVIDEIFKKCQRSITYLLAQIIRPGEKQIWDLISDPHSFNSDYTKRLTLLKNRLGGTVYYNPGFPLEVFMRNALGTPIPGLPQLKNLQDILNDAILVAEQTLPTVQKARDEFIRKLTVEIIPDLQANIDEALDVLTDDAAKKILENLKAVSDQLIDKFFKQKQKTHAELMNFHAEIQSSIDSVSMLLLTANAQAARTKIENKFQEQKRLIQTKAQQYEADIKIDKSVKQPGYEKAKKQIDKKQSNVSIGVSTWTSTIQRLEKYVDEFSNEVQEFVQICDAAHAALQQNSQTAATKLHNLRQAFKDEYLVPANALIDAYNALPFSSREQIWRDSSDIKHSSNYIWIIDGAISEKKLTPNEINELIREHRLVTIDLNGTKLSALTADKINSLQKEAKFVLSKLPSIITAETNKLLYQINHQIEIYGVTVGNSYVAVLANLRDRKLRLELDQNNDLNHVTEILQLKNDAEATVKTALAAKIETLRTTYNSALERFKAATQNLDTDLRVNSRESLANKIEIHKKLGIPTRKNSLASLSEVEVSENCKYVKKLFDDLPTLQSHGGTFSKGFNDRLADLEKIFKTECEKIEKAIGDLQNNLTVQQNANAQYTGASTKPSLSSSTMPSASSSVSIADQQLVIQNLLNPLRTSLDILNTKIQIWNLLPIVSEQQWNTHSNFYRSFLNVGSNIGNFSNKEAIQRDGKLASINLDENKFINLTAEKIRSLTKEITHMSDELTSILAKETQALLKQISHQIEIYGVIKNPDPSTNANISSLYSLADLRTEHLKLSSQDDITLDRMTAISCLKAKVEETTKTALADKIKELQENYNQERQKFYNTKDNMDPGVFAERRTELVKVLKIRTMLGIPEQKNSLAELTEEELENSPTIQKLYAGVTSLQPRSGKFSRGFDSHLAELEKIFKTECDKIESAIAKTNVSTKSSTAAAPKDAIKIIERKLIELNKQISFYEENFATPEVATTISKFPKDLEDKLVALKLYLNDTRPLIDPTITSTMPSKNGDVSILKRQSNAISIEIAKLTVAANLQQENYYQQTIDSIDNLTTAIKEVSKNFENTPIIERISKKAKDIEEVLKNHVGSINSSRIEGTNYKKFDPKYPVGFDHPNVDVWLTKLESSTDFNSEYPFMEDGGLQSLNTKNKKELLQIEKRMASVFDKVYKINYPKCRAHVDNLTTICDQCLAPLKTLFSVDRRREQFKEFYSEIDKLNLHLTNKKPAGHKQDFQSQIDELRDLEHLIIDMIKVANEIPAVLEKASSIYLKEICEVVVSELFPLLEKFERAITNDAAKSRISNFRSRIAPLINPKGEFLNQDLTPERLKQYGNEIFSLKAEMLTFQLECNWNLRKQEIKEQLTRDIALIEQRSNQYKIDVKNSGKKQSCFDDVQTNLKEAREKVEKKLAFMSPEKSQARGASSRSQLEPIHYEITAGDIDEINRLVTDFSQKREVFYEVCDLAKADAIAKQDELQKTFEGVLATVCDKANRLLEEAAKSHNSASVKVSNYKFVSKYTFLNPMTFLYDTYSFQRELWKGESFSSSWEFADLLKDLGNPEKSPEGFKKLNPETTSLKTKTKKELAALEKRIERESDVIFYSTWNQLGFGIRHLLSIIIHRENELLQLISANEIPERFPGYYEKILQLRNILQANGFDYLQFSYEREKFLDNVRTLDEKIRKRDILQEIVNLSIDLVSDSMIPAVLLNARVSLLQGDYLPRLDSLSQKLINVLIDDDKIKNTITLYQANIQKIKADQDAIFNTINTENFDNAKFLQFSKDIEYQLIELQVLLLDIEKHKIKSSVAQYAIDVKNSGKKQIHFDPQYSVLVQKEKLVQQQINFIKTMPHPNIVLARKDLQVLEQLMSDYSVEEQKFFQVCDKARDDVTTEYNRLKAIFDGYMRQLPQGDELKNFLISARQQFSKDYVDKMELKFNFLNSPLPLSTSKGCLKELHERFDRWQELNDQYKKDSDLLKDNNTSLAASKATFEQTYIVPLNNLIKAFNIFPWGEGKCMFGVNEETKTLRYIAFLRKEVAFGGFNDSEPMDDGKIDLLEIDQNKLSNQSLTNFRALQNIIPSISETLTSFIAKESKEFLAEIKSELDKLEIITNQDKDEIEKLFTAYNAQYPQTSIPSYRQFKVNYDDLRLKANKLRENNVDNAFQLQFVQEAFQLEFDLKQAVNKAFLFEITVLRLNYNAAIKKFTMSGGRASKDVFDGACMRLQQNLKLHETLKITGQNNYLLALTEEDLSVQKCQYIRDFLKELPSLKAHALFGKGELDKKLLSLKQTFAAAYATIEQEITYLNDNQYNPAPQAAAPAPQQAPAPASASAQTTVAKPSLSSATHEDKEPQLSKEDTQPTIQTDTTKTDIHSTVADKTQGNLFTDTDNEQPADVATAPIQSAPIQGTTTETTAPQTISVASQAASQTQDNAAQSSVSQIQEAAPQVSSSTHPVEENAPIKTTAPAPADTVDPLGVATSEQDARPTPVIKPEVTVTQSSSQSDQVAPKASAPAGGLSSASFFSIHVAASLLGSSPLPANSQATTIFGDSAESTNKKDAPKSAVVTKSTADKSQLPQDNVVPPPVQSVNQESDQVASTQQSAPVAEPISPVTSNAETAPTAAIKKQDTGPDLFGDVSSVSKSVAPSTSSNQQTTDNVDDTIAAIEALREKEEQDKKRKSSARSTPASRPVSTFGDTVADIFKAAGLGPEEESQTTTTTTTTTATSSSSAMTGPAHTPAAAKQATVATSNTQSSQPSAGAAKPEVKGAHSSKQSPTKPVAKQPTAATPNAQSSQLPAGAPDAKGQEPVSKKTPVTSASTTTSVVTAMAKASEDDAKNKSQTPNAEQDKRKTASRTNKLPISNAEEAEAALPDNEYINLVTAQIQDQLGDSEKVETPANKKPKKASTIRTEPIIFDVRGWATLLEQYHRNTSQQCKRFIDDYLQKHPHISDGEKKAVGELKTAFANLRETPEEVASLFTKDKIGFVQRKNPTLTRADAIHLIAKNHAELQQTRYLNNIKQYSEKINGGLVRSLINFVKGLIFGREKVSESKDLLTQLDFTASSNFPRQQLATLIKDERDYDQMTRKLAATTRRERPTSHFQNPWDKKDTTTKSSLSSSTARDTKPAETKSSTPGKPTIETIKEKIETLMSARANMLASNSNADVKAIEVIDQELTRLRQSPQVRERVELLQRNRMTFLASKGGVVKTQFDAEIQLLTGKQFERSVRPTSEYMQRLNNNTVTSLIK